MAPQLSRDPEAPSYWEQASQDLAALDPVWRNLIVRHGDRALRSRGEPFYTLARSIVGQQISTAAADAVWARLEALLGGEVTPEVVIQTPGSDLRSAGLSQSKVNYVLSLAAFAEDGALSLQMLSGLSDEEVVSHLCTVKGIGPWTAQMFLMFGLLRPDVWPVADLGVQKGISRQFYLGEPVGVKEALQFGEKLRPWRSVAAWFLWRSLDPTVVDY